MGVLAGTHQCALRCPGRLASGTKLQSLVVVAVCSGQCLRVRVRGRVSRSCATENSYTPARLEALLELSDVNILSHLRLTRSTFYSKVSAGCGRSLR